MANALGTKPERLTFDCYGTLIQWDEGLIVAAQKILSRQRDATIDARTLIKVFGRHAMAQSSALIEDELSLVTSG